MNSQTGKQVGGQMRSPHCLGPTRETSCPHSPSRPSFPPSLLPPRDQSQPCQPPGSSLGKLPVVLSQDFPLAIILPRELSACLPVR